MGTAAPTIEPKVQRIPSMMMTLTGTQLSDLFFNHDVSGYHNAVEAGLNDEDVQQALHEDAVTFCGILGCDDSYAEAFVHDFLDRV